MKIDLSKEEYRVLVEVFSLTGMVLDSYGRDRIRRRNLSTNWSKKSMPLATTSIRRT